MRVRPAYDLIISTKALDQLKKILKDHQKAIITSLTEIIEDPILGKPLIRELSGKFSFRVGVYRIVYKVDQKDRRVIVLRIGHRSKVYN